MLFLFCTLLVHATAAQKPFALGVVDTLHSNELGETRTLNIYLPEGYDATDTTSYPVV
ncbi:MAG: alpha/beta hydrolase, partial [Chitinophagaceae bacterium]